MDLNELSQRMAPPTDDRLLWEIYCAFTHAGRDEPHQTFARLVNAMQLLVNQNRLLSGMPGLDHPNENGAMVPRDLLPPVPGMSQIRKKRITPGSHQRVSTSDKGAPQ
jgi:hypothetical protein